MGTGTVALPTTTNTTNGFYRRFASGYKSAQDERTGYIYLLRSTLVAGGTNGGTLEVLISKNYGSSWTLSQTITLNNFIASYYFALDIHAGVAAISYCSDATVRVTNSGARLAVFTIDAATDQWTARTNSVEYGYGAEVLPTNNGPVTPATVYHHDVKVTSVGTGSSTRVAIFCAAALRGNTGDGTTYPYNYGAWIAAAAYTFDTANPGAGATQIDKNNRQINYNTDSTAVYAVVGCELFDADVNGKVTHANPNLVDVLFTGFNGEGRVASGVRRYEFNPDGTLLSVIDQINHVMHGTTYSVLYSSYNGNLVRRPGVANEFWFGRRSSATAIAITKIIADRTAKTFTYTNTLLTTTGTAHAMQMDFEPDGTNLFIVSLVSSTTLYRIRYNVATAAISSAEAVLQSITGVAYTLEIPRIVHTFKNGVAYVSGTTSPYPYTYYWQSEMNGVIEPGNVQASPSTVQVGDPVTISWTFRDPNADNAMNAQTKYQLRWRKVT